MKNIASIARNLTVIALSLLPSIACADPLDIITADGKKITLQIETADTEAEREKGLMFREKMEPDTGMLFIFDEVDSPKFWMKNTKIPLDMVYIGEDGLVKGIYANAKPEDLTPIPAPAPSLAVLEINGGAAETLGISTGAKVIHKLFEKGLK